MQIFFYYRGYIMYFTVKTIFLDVFIFLIVKYLYKLFGYNRTFGLNRTSGDYIEKI
jgi:hypothetical protein